MVFWWTGSGYLALLTLIGVYGLFGALLTAVFGDGVFESLPWLWGIAAALSSVATWFVGCRINHRPVTVRKLTRLRDRLYYPARNRFVSLPVETWAVPMAALAVFLIVRGLLIPPL